MSQSTTCPDLSLIAGADLSAGQYLFVEESAATDRTVTVCNAITDKALGVLQNDPDAAGQAAVVRVYGTSKVVAGAAITRGAAVAPMASGKAQTAVSTQFPRGIALESAAADGDVIEIVLIAGGVPLA
jgi:hypothetical protein